MELNYTIPLVTDDMEGERFTCTAVAGPTTYTETVVVQVKGVSVYLIFSKVLYNTKSSSPVPPDSLEVKTAVSQSGPLEAGNTSLTLTCTVTERTLGLTKMPSAIWMMAGSPVILGGDSNMVNTTTAISTLSFSSLNTSHAGLYHCQGRLESPPGNISLDSMPAISVNVRCE